MNHIDLNDPRLTAYALDEMAPAERAEFEQALAQDPAAQKTVEEIRAAGALLADVLEHEPVEAAHPAAKVPAREPYAKVISFPYGLVAGLAAACFAVFFVLQDKSAIELKPARVAEAAAKSAVNEKKNKEAQVVKLDEFVVASLAEAGARSKDEKHQEAGEQQPMALPVAAVPAPAMVAADLAAPPSPTTFSAGAGANFGYVARLSKERQPSPLAVTGGKQAPGRMAGLRAEPEADTEAYSFRKDSDYLRVADQPLSTFAADVDTASYANVRRFLLAGQRPPADAVRIEELVNYFPYQYRPAAGNAPFAAHLEVAGAPWAPTHRLVRIGIKGRELSDAARPAANLVFLLDVSGSMDEPNKLPLVKQSLRLLVEKLRPDDHVAIAVYAGASGLALPSTPASHKAEILDAIERLQAEGSTNGAMGIQLAYDIAKANFITGGVNRVILATDGDFNVGVTSEGGLVRLVEEKAKSGVFLTVLGFGMGNYKDSTLEQLADKGNGNYAYIDSLAEARKTLVEQAGGTLVTIAKDVKLQVEFNPAVVAAYRLIGYENRLLGKEDFNNDKVDAGEIGAGHTVTALYEVVPVGADLPAPGKVDALKYQNGTTTGATATPPSKQRGEVAAAPELLTVKIRYKEPAGDTSSLLEFPLRDTGAGFAQASADFKFAAAVAAFGMVLRDSPHKGAATLADVLAWGREGLGSDAGGYRREFISLVERAQQAAQ